MSNEMKELRVDCVNKIRYETREEFKNSLFSDVYLKAKTLVSEIITANSKGEKLLPDKEFCTEEQYSNIISFWGERGMGKSSAMLSFALFLKKYEYQKGDLFNFEGEKCPQFYVLARIDAAMLVKGENLLDIILAKMWSDFEDAQNHRDGWNVSWENTKKQFDNVKKSYDLYRGADNSGSFSMTSVRQLKELSKCLNLKNDFKKLVENYLDCMVKKATEPSESFFVITIDDLDVVVDEVDGILEQIRMFLTIPRVIVLVTADRGRLFLECNKVFFNRMLSKDNMGDAEKKLVRSYVDKYLAKIFPANMRVYMPALTGVNEVKCTISFQDDDCFKTLKEMDERQALFCLLYQITGIMMNPFDYHRHLFQQSSLRTIVNCLHELIKINKMNSGKIEAGRAWMRTELEVFINSLNDVSIIESGNILLATESEYIHEALSEELSKIHSDIHIQIGNYGMLLNCMLKLDDRDNHDFVHFILCLYSIHVSNLFGEQSIPNEEMLTLYSKDVFNDSLQLTTLNDFQQNKIITSSLFQMEFISSYTNGKPEQIFLDNIEMIYNVFKVYNLCVKKFCDSEISAYQMYVAKIEEYAHIKQEDTVYGKHKKIITLTLDKPDIKGYEETYYEITLDSIINNFMHYEKNLKDFCRNILTALYKWSGYKYDNKKIEKAVENMITNHIFKCSDYKSWAEQWEIKSILDLLPLSSTEVMFELVKKLKGTEVAAEINQSVIGNILDEMKQYMATLKEELKNVEGYYNLNVEGRKPIYYEKIKDYDDKLKPFDIEYSMLNLQKGDKSIKSKATADIL